MKLKFSYFSSVVAAIFLLATSSSAAEEIPDKAKMVDFNQGLWYKGPISWNKRYDLMLKVESNLIVNALIIEKDKIVPQSKFVKDNFIEIAFSEHTDELIGFAVYKIPVNLLRDDQKNVYYVLISDRRVDVGELKGIKDGQK